MKIDGPDDFSASCRYLLQDEKDDVDNDSTNNYGRISLQNMKQTITELRKVDEMKKLRRNSASPVSSDLRRMMKSTSHVLK